MELIIGVIIWFVIRAFAQRSKQAKGQGTQSGSGTKRAGGWSEMLGLPQGEGSAAKSVWQQIEEAFSEQTTAQRHEVVAPKPVVTAQPLMERSMGSMPPPTRMESVFDNYRSSEGFSGAEGVDDCHEYMLTDHESAEAALAAAPAGKPLGLNLDASALMQGVVLAEILTRPSQRRRLGTWQRH